MILFSEFNGNSNDLIQGNKCYSLMKDTQPAFLPEFLSSPRTLGRFNQPLAVPPLPPRRSVHPKVPGSSTLMGIQGLTGTSIIVMPSSHLLWQDDIVTPEYLCQKIAFIEKLGEGCFGEVSSQSLLNFFSILCIAWKNCMIHSLFYVL